MSGAFAYRITGVWRADTPYGLCGCGCGRPTPIAKRTRPDLGHVRGEPTPRLPGHGRRRQRIVTPADYTLEDCGYATPCWIWAHPIGPQGYGNRLGYRGRLGPPHRVLYEQVNGPIGDGLVLDHLCRVRCCVNPAHLEPVTPGENTRRGVMTKLSLEVADLIRTDPRSHRIVAADYGISKSLVAQVRRGEKWVSDVSSRRQDRRATERRSNAFCDA